MAKQEYILSGNVCPACNQPYNSEETERGSTVKCSYCGYERLLRTPLQKKRENIVLRNYIDGLQIILKVMFCAYLLFLLPVVLFALIGPYSLAEIWKLHPIGSVIYLIAIFAIVSVPFIILLFAVPIRRIRKHNYSMEWLREYYAKKSDKKLSFDLDLEFWEDAINEHKDSIGN
ncbi:hypothetical protein LJC45_03960 [Alistipes sp. OttesenSCG-928-B03]|nr:hypothetical protein [Alistipes sp. OttesenSCG-928-B03]